MFSFYRVYIVHIKILLSEMLEKLWSKDKQKGKYARKAFVQYACHNLWNVVKTCNKSH